MSPTFVVIAKIASMFLVIGAGWIIRRRRIIDEHTTPILSRLTTDVALPCLIFQQMLATVDRTMLLNNLATILAAMGVIIFAQLVGWAGWRLFATKKQAPTFIFCVATNNWVFLPLPIIQVLYGSEGVALLLLCNAGIQLLLWTVLVAILQGGRIDRSSLTNLIKNPGFLATIAGMAIAALPQQPGGTAISVTLEAMEMIGSLTIPLSLLVTGAQLGALRPSGSHPPLKALSGIFILRLLIAPLLTLGLIYLAALAGWQLPPLPQAIVFLTATMPVAISCSILAERFNQDTRLAAQSIFYTTLGSIVTVPILFSLFTALLG